MNNQEQISNQEQINKPINQKNKKKSKKIIIPIILGVVAVFISLLVVNKESLFNKNKENDNNKNMISTDANKTYSQYRINSNSLEYFDLSFLQLENKKANKIYSPLSIKFALGMLNEGTEGVSKKQISNVIGSYKSNKYSNSSNMSFANALFVRDTFKANIKDEYVNTLSTKYNAEVIYDSFTSADNVNNWVSNKTFKLINNLFDKVDNNDFILINALAIDMEWKNKIQSEDNSYSVDFQHENFSHFVSALKGIGYQPLDFYNYDKKAKSVQIGAVANKYDIVKELGEDKIRQEVGEAYKKWLAEGACGSPENEPDVNTYLNTYIKEINSNYKQFSSSTDFLFYNDENIKAFAKDLKEYNNTTLQYIGIMPKQEELDKYIENTDADKINEIINNLKGIELDSFKDGVVTKITGHIPMFKFDYELDLMNDLKTMGITDIFDSSKANLSGLTKAKNTFINTAVHKANIEFSNEGIKAAAATAVGGFGSAGCWFAYDYDVPVEEINLTFDKPFIFLIRDKKTNEVWFTGTVYEPIEWEPNPGF